MNVAFPLDWKNNEIAYWMANAFFFTEITLTILSVLFSVIIRSLLISSSLRYEILGCQIRNMGTTNKMPKKRKTLQVENLFLKDLIAAINSHQHTEK